MKAGNLLRVLAVSAVLTTSAALTIQPAAAAGSTTYYIDATAGSDTNAGTSPGAAWQTLAKVDATTFNPGDRILFHTDQT